MFDGGPTIELGGNTSGEAGVFARREQGEHYGPQADDEYKAFWQMQVFGKSHGSGGNGSQPRKITTDAMHSQHPLALAERKKKCINKKSTCTDERLQIDVYVGRND